MSDDKFEALLKVEKQATKLLKNRKEQYFKMAQYLGFVRGIYGIKTNPENFVEKGEEWEDRTRLVIKFFAKWVMRGLDLDVLLKLMRIQDVDLVFTVNNQSEVRT